MISNDTEKDEMLVQIIFYLFLCSDIFLHPYES